MPRASTIIVLVLLGSALSLIGWSCYRSLEDDEYGRSHGGQGSHRSHGPSFLWFWGGGSSYGGGGGSSPGQSGGVSRGGFGGHGGGGAAVGG